MYFAFFWRVSTEDNQDPTASRNWQYTRARSLIEPHGGSIVAEYSDVGHSRSVPWQRRPGSKALLDALADPNRGFDAVVIGEPQRAFYGNQFGNTFPLFVHYGVQLWVPEVGGPIDPTSEAHDLVMSVFAGMSKGERNRIKLRVRTAMAAQAELEGRFLGGRPPYGYRLVDAGPHPNPAKAAEGRRLQRLAPDPITAPVVERIFAEYVSGLGIYAIAEGLARDGIPSPSAYDPRRNPHRCGTGWAKSAVRAILLNPRYTGYQVWNRQRKDEVLIDVTDVALGHETKLRWNTTEDWIWSERPAHEPLISRETFELTQELMRAQGKRPHQRKPHRSRHGYQFKGLLLCGIDGCGRRMQGQRNHDESYYRCRFPQQYALAQGLEHPRNVYLRERELVDPLEHWLGRVFDPDYLEDTVRRLAAAAGDTTTTAAPVAAAQARIQRCEARLAQYRAALDAGADPVLVAEWIAEVEAERTAATAELKAHKQRTRQLTADDIRHLVHNSTKARRALRRAKPEDKNELYRQLGLRLVYQPERHLVSAEVNPVGFLMCPRGDLNPHPLDRGLAPQASASAIPPLGLDHTAAPRRVRGKDS
ncbi:putative recombinase [Longimycelium tulufanense]|uniref:Putative recombinase n=1 Tax=Longimycelium tulufanense TaxID=907463 RepID=A0A8J3CJ01_9PSEU|nr:putative recombinase [Longimycelium tulufanense]